VREKEQGREKEMRKRKNEIESASKKREERAKKTTGIQEPSGPVFIPRVTRRVPNCPSHESICASLQSINTPFLKAPKLGGGDPWLL
jgi:hypothetical protein